jgi:hypothetical protein
MYLHGVNERGFKINFLGVHVMETPRLSSKRILSKFIILPYQIKVRDKIMTQNTTTVNS